jgi:hypothetical protein
MSRSHVYFYSELYLRLLAAGVNQATGNDTVSVAKATIHFGTAPPEALYMGLEARVLNKKCQGLDKEAPFGVAL